MRCLAQLILPCPDEEQRRLLWDHLATCPRCHFPALCPTGERLHRHADAGRERRPVRELLAEEAPDAR